MREVPRVPMKGGAVSRRHSRWPLVLIGLERVLKAAGLVGVSFGAAYLLKPEQHHALGEWVNQWRLDPHSHLLYELLEKVLAIKDGDLRWLRVGTLVYAGLYSLEGIGLLQDKAWGEWLLVVTTGLLLPVEAWELWERVTWPRAGVLVLNGIMAVYVCFRLRWRLEDRRLRGADEASGRAQEG